MTVAQHEERVTDRVELIALDLIDPAKDNPRRQLGDVAELAQSIHAVGLLEPLVVTPRGDRYLLVCGARRHAACLVAEIDATTCVIREFSEAERQEAMLIENLQRVDLAVLEEATSYSRLVDLGYTQRQLADRVGRSQAHISKRLALLALPAEVRKEVDSGGITLEDAQQLTKLLEHPKRLVAAFKRRREWGGLERQVGFELDAIKVAAKIAAARSKLEADGIRIVEMKAKQSYYQPEIPAGMAIVSPNAYNGVHLDPKKHAELDKGCHAAAVNPSSGDVVYVCTKPANHGSRKPGLTKAERDERERRKTQLAMERQLQEQAETREAFLAKLITSKLPKGEILSEFVAGLLRQSGVRETDLAGELLELEPTKVKLYGRDADSYEPSLVAHAAKGETELTRVGLALALASAESLLPAHSYSSWDDGWEGSYLEWLARHGYEISAAERDKLDAAKGSRR